MPWPPIVPSSRAAVIGSLAFAITVLAGHAAMAVVMLSLLPRGFPWFHPRFLANEVIPLVLLAASIAGGASSVWRPRTTMAWLLGFPLAWLGVAVGVAGLFPLTGAAVVRPASVGASLLTAGWLLTFTAFGTPRRRVMARAVVGGGIGFVVGISLPLSQRPHAPATVPLPAGPRLQASTQELDDARRTFVLTHAIQVDGDDGRVDVNVGSWRLHVYPMLTFTSSSPDGFWTLFAPRPAEGTSRLRAAPQGNSLLLHDDTFRQLRVEPLTPDGVEIETWTHLERDICSHLNSFAELQVEGHQRLALRFSPCPEALIEVTHADYPSGAPARFAYVDEHRIFRIVQATDAEKGPFITLAQGTLGPDEPLSVGMVEVGLGEPRTVVTLEFKDWSHELSTALSPTAGFGVAENAIQFGLVSRPSASAAQLFLTLAGTGIGRGWDCVAHRAGYYRNRLTVRAAN